jgi:flagellar hook-length control protein FliK
MNSDAMASSFFTRIKIQAGRMDRAAGTDQTLPTPGFGGVQGCSKEEGRSFKEVYALIAQTNREAVKVTDSSVSAQSASRRIANVNHDHDDNPCIDSGRDTRVIPYENARVTEGGALSSAPSDPVGAADDSSQLPPELRAILDKKAGSGPVDESDPATMSKAASELISQALQTVSDGLHLTVDPALKNLSIETTSQETVQQLSEVLFTLKKIAGLLDEAAAQNKQLDTGAQIIDPTEARQLSSLLHAQAFRVEIGASMLGIADQVSAAVAQKLSLPFSGDIPQAADPSQMSTPQAQALFKELLGESSGGLSALAEKIRELCAQTGQTSSQQGVVFTDGAKADGVVSPFDSPTMRKLLKIDGKQGTAAQNAEAAAQGDKLELPLAVAKTVAKNLTPEAVKVAEDLVPAGDATGKMPGGPGVQGLEAKPAVSTARTLDESVMKQITERMQAAVRSGVTELRIQVRPEALGEVKLRIRIEGDVVFARIQVESQQVKQIVETNLQQLKDSLAQQQLQTGSLEVQVGGEGWHGPQERSVDDGAYSAGRVADGDSATERGGTDDNQKTMALGTETGRRFGGNSIEYFA